MTQGSERRPTSHVPFGLTGHKYRSAPIVEAIIEIRCALADGVDLETLMHVVDKDKFPQADGFYEFQGSLELSGTEAHGVTGAKQIGHVFRDAEGHSIVQARLNGFAFSVLSPYTTWEEFSTESVGYWRRFAEFARPTSVSRLGVRYVNKIDIPKAQIEIKDYVRTGIDVSPYLPQAVAAYFLQIEVPLEEFDASATITSTLGNPPGEGYSSLILDIDTWRPVSLQLPDCDADIWSGLEELRRAKNYVFEACITDATRGLIDADPS